MPESASRDAIGVRGIEGEPLATGIRVTKEVGWKKQGRSPP